MRYFLAILLISNILFGDSDESSELRYPFSDISYGGMTIQCNLSCGEPEDPYFLKIAAILAKCVNKVFNDCMVLDDAFESRFIHPWGEGNEADLFYDHWNWNATRGFWPSKNTTDKLGLGIPTKTLRVDTYSNYLDAVQALRQDVNFYYFQAPRLAIKNYKLLLPKLKEIDQDKYRSIDISNENDFFLYPYQSSGSRTSHKIREFIKDIEYEIVRMEKNLPYYDSQYQKKSAIVEDSIDSIDSCFKSSFIYCLKNHQVEGAAFTTAVENLIGGDYDKALGQIQFLIDFTEKRGMENELVGKLYLLKGQLQSEFCLYSEAVIGLTTAIQKNPSQKEAYIERAAAYFELGEFDLAIEDYLASDFENLDPNHKIAWSKIPLLSSGIAVGIAEGAGQALLDFVPEALSTVRGMGNGLWAFSADPVGASKAFSEAAVQCIDYIKKNSAFILAQDIVPELKELVQNYDQLTDFHKGKLIGQIIGKYGTDILICTYSTKAIKAYRDLKRANQLMTLEALANPTNSQALVKASSSVLDSRREMLSNIKIVKDHQAKHILGHPRYINGRSILTHSDPQALLKKAGTGRKIRGEIGEAGSKEKINFGEMIGYHVDIDTKVQTETTWGIVHYSKKGAHIVPELPDKL